MKEINAIIIIYIFRFRLAVLKKAEKLLPIICSFKSSFNRLADDRDRIGFSLPNEQKAGYGRGAGKRRPVYFVSPKPHPALRHISTKKITGPTICNWPLPGYQWCPFVNRGNYHWAAIRFRKR